MALDHPRDLFGPWESLEPQVQDGLRRLAEDHIRHAMELFPKGSLWTGLIRGCWELDRYIAETGHMGWARSALITAANRLSFGPLTLRRRLEKRFRAWRASRESDRSGGGGPTFTFLLDAAGRSAMWLLGDFAQGVRVDHRARGYYHDPEMNFWVGYHVGLDLMPTPTGVVCLEANLQSMISNDLRLQERPDVPTARILALAALEHGVRRVVWVEGHRVFLRPWFLERLVAEGARLGIHVEVVEDPRLPRRREVPRGGWVPNRMVWVDPPREHTLVVRRNEFPVGPDYVVNHKEPSIRGLHAVFTARGEERVRVLPQVRVPRSVPELKDDGLPNLVYKYPAAMAGAGVFFLRARDPAHALKLARALDRERGEGPGVFQDFALSTLESGNRVCDVRAEIFISPLGTWVLDLTKREATAPIPDRHPDGRVDAPGQLTSNMSTGGRHGTLSQEERDAMEAAATAVGDGLRTVLERTFVTGPHP